MKRIIAAIAICAAFFIGCGESHNSEEHDHGHPHEEESGLEAMAFTLYSDKTELFVEFKPLVVGMETKFAAHFTMLGENFLPVTEGSVTLQLTGSAGNQEIVSTTPSNPGIFRLVMTPTSAGEYTLIFNVTTPTYKDTVVIEHVVVYADEQSAIAAHPPEAGGGNEITYLKEQAWKIEFANEPVHAQPFSEVIHTSGQITSAPGDERMIVASSTGIVLFSGNGIVQGSEVKSGQSLFSITGGALTGNNIDVRFQEAKTNLEKADADLQRGKELAKTNIISQRDLLELQTKYTNAQTAFNLVAKDYSSGGQRVSSSMNGFIKNILVSQGQYVSEGQALATVAQNKRLQLRVDVPVAQFNKLPMVVAANFSMAGNKAVFSTEQLNGKVLSYSKNVEANSPFVSVTFEIDNAPGIVPGSFTDVYLKTSATSNVLTVPVSSLIEEQEHFFIYVQTAGESFEKREVQTGSSDGQRIQLLTGIAEGERVVSKGAFQIKLATMSGVIPAHGHEH